MSNTPEWVSLREASDILGVHPSTLRRWSDEGQIEHARTQGGHRRFRRDALEAFLATREADAPPAPAATARPAPLAAQGGSAPWRAAFTGEHREAMRHLGQRLLGLMLQYITRQNEDERFLQESRAIGQTYGTEIAQAGLTMLQTVEAFLSFRSQFTDMALQFPAMPRPGDDAETRRLHSRIDRFMNEVLLGTIEGWEAVERENGKTGGAGKR